MSPEAAALLLSISLGLQKVLSWMKTQTTSCSDWPLRWPLFRFKIICTEMTVFCQSFYYRQGGSLYTGDNIPLRQYSKISKNFMLQELGFAVCKTELWIITRVTHKPVSSKPANPFPLLPLDCEMAAPLWQQSQTAEQTDFGVLWRLRRKRNLPE